MTIKEETLKLIRAKEPLPTQEHLGAARDLKAEGAVVKVGTGYALAKK